MQQSLPGQPVGQQDLFLLPEAREVAPGIWKITQPIPFPLRTVNMYALIAQDGWALIDSGMGTPEARTAFTAALQRAGLHIADLRTILLTHHHPDHIGLSGELQELSGATVYMYPIDEIDLHGWLSRVLLSEFSRLGQVMYPGARDDRLSIPAPPVRSRSPLRCESPAARGAETA